MRPRSAGSVPWLAAESDEGVTAAAKNPCAALTKIKATADHASRWRSVVRAKNTRDPPATRSAPNRSEAAPSTMLPTKLAAL